MNFGHLGNARISPLADLAQDVRLRGFCQRPPTGSVERQGASATRLPFERLARAGMTRRFASQCSPQTTGEVIGRCDRPRAGCRSLASSLAPRRRSAPSPRGRPMLARLVAWPPAGASCSRRSGEDSPPSIGRDTIASARDCARAISCVHRAVAARAPLAGLLLAGRAADQARASCRGDGATPLCTSRDWPATMRGLRPNGTPCISHEAFRGKG